MKIISIKVSSDGFLQIYSRWFYFGGCSCHGRTLVVTPIGFIQCQSDPFWRIPSGFFLGICSWGLIYIHFLRWDIDLNPIRQYTRVNCDTKIEIKLARIRNVLRKAVEMGL